MKKNIKLLIALIIVGIIIVACSLYYRKNDAVNTHSPSVVSNQSVGGDRDTHGCIGSAGYSWCQAKNICERSWESYCTSAVAKTVTFSCEGSKTIIATFYPTDDKFVDLKLSDERSISLPRVVSASGARYAKEDETLVFWNKGDTAFITEGKDAVQTFSKCVVK